MESKEMYYIWVDEQTSEVEFFPLLKLNRCGGTSSDTPHDEQSRLPDATEYSTLPGIDKEKAVPNVLFRADKQNHTVIVYEKTKRLSGSECISGAEFYAPRDIIV